MTIWYAAPTTGAGSGGAHPVNGSDANDGLTRTTPKTLNGACVASVDDDTIILVTSTAPHVVGLNYIWPLKRLLVRAEAQGTFDADPLGDGGGALASRFTRTSIIDGLTRVPAGAVALNKRITFQDIRFQLEKSLPVYPPLGRQFSGNLVSATSTTAIAVAGHTFANGDRVFPRVITGGVTGLSSTTKYYVVNAVAGVSLELSLTAGGAAVPFSGTGTTLLNEYDWEEATGVAQWDATGVQTQRGLIAGLYTNTTTLALFDVKGCQFFCGRLGDASNAAVRLPIATDANGGTLPEMDAANPYYNRLGNMPIGISGYWGGGVIEDCLFSDLQHGVSLIVTAKGVVRRNWLTNIYQDDLFVAYYHADAEWLTYGNIHQDKVGKDTDRQNPHGDINQSIILTTGLTADNPGVAKKQWSFNNLTFATSAARGAAQQDFWQGGRHNIALFPSYYLAPLCRNNIRIAGQKLVQFPQHRWGLAEGNIGVNLTDFNGFEPTDPPNNIIVPETALTSFGLPTGLATTVFRSNIIEAINADSVDVVRTNNAVTGQRGASIPLANIVNGTMARAGKVTPQDWWAAIQRKAAYSATGPQGYASLRAWLSETEDFAVAPLKTLAQFAGSLNAPLSTVAYSGIAYVWQAQGQNVALAGMPGGVEWQELNAEPTYYSLNGPTGVFTKGTHGFANTTQLQIVQTSGPLTGLTVGTTYFVVNATTNTFQLSATSGGAPITTLALGTLTGAIAPASKIRQAWRTGSGTILGGSFLQLRRTSAATPVTPTLTTFSLDGNPQSWSLVTKSNNVFPVLYNPPTHRFALGTTALGTDSPYLSVYFEGVLGGAGTAQWLISGVTGSGGAMTMYLAIDNKIYVRGFDTNGSSVQFATGVAVPRDNATTVRLLACYDFDKASPVEGCVIWYQFGTGPWQQTIGTGSWPSASRLFRWSRTADAQWLLGSTTAFTECRVNVLAASNTRIDLWDAFPPALTNRAAPDWTGETLKGIFGTQPLIGLVGVESRANNASLRHYGTIAAARITDSVSTVLSACSFDGATDTVTKTAHGLINGTPVRLSAISGTMSLVTGTTYYVVNTATNTFQLAASQGGAPIDFTTTPTPTATVNQVVGVPTGASQQWPVALSLLAEVQTAAPYVAGQPINVLVYPVGSPQAINVTGTANLAGTWSSNPVDMPELSNGIIMTFTPSAAGTLTLDFADNASPDYTNPASLAVEVTDAPVPPPPTALGRPKRFGNGFGFGYA